ncbi:IclR family transcriptional regulator [Asticcacaulis sp.]|uniref:IclR family transcriptional regulator n=1 Tax=Asticcacaulis sp. TaxID=1872648 RepID=UPI002CF62F88|nr:IclR family transcriptional regulator [Asticcacaulis sp.]HTM82884.1 IclR family transcriptional regulator [Asticcacaulis sp.]
MIIKTKDSPETLTKAHTYSAPALEKGFNVIELLAENPQGLTISEIAAGLGLSMSEIFRIIMVMERRGWLKRKAGDRLRVATKVLDLAFKSTPAEELIQAAAPLMRELVQRVEQSCHLVIGNGNSGLVVFRQQAPGPTVFAVRIGAGIALEDSCSGHVLLAFNALDLDPSLTVAAQSGPLSATLQRVRARGYEMMKSTRTLGVTDLSYPVFDGQGHAFAALTIPFLQLVDGTQTVDSKEARICLQEIASRISDELSGAR